MSGIRHTPTAADTVLGRPVERWRRRPVETASSVAPSAGAHAAAEETSFGLPFHLFCLLTFAVLGRPNDYFLWLVPFRIALVFTVLTVAATLLQAKRSALSPFTARETKLYLVFYAAMVAGIPFAVYRPGAFEDVILKYIVNVTYFLLFLVHVDSVAKLKRVAAVLLISVFLFTYFSFANGQFIGGRFVTGSRMFDPNDVAFVEVSLVSFALWVMVGRFSRVLKLVAITNVLLGVLLTLYTASRGGLLGLVTFLACFMFLKVPRVGKSFKGALLVILIVGAVANADKINVERYMTMGALEDDYNLAEGGRVDVWERAARLFIERPLTGVGVGSFGPAIFQQRRSEGVLPRWQAAHSAYMLVLTETGIVGATAFFLLIITTLQTFNRLRRAPQALGKELGVLPGLLLMGFCAQLVAALFLSQAYSMFFTLAFALSATLNRMAEPATTTANLATARN